MREHEVTAHDGSVLRIEVDGDGPAWAWLHGSFDGPGTFAALRARIGTGRRLILPTLRGHGSGPAIFDRSYRFDTTEVDDLVAVLDAVGVERVNLLGHSTGGAVAVAFALAHPDRVERVVAIEPTLTRLLDPTSFAALRAELDPVVALAEAGEHRAALDRLLTFLAGADWTGLPEKVRAKVLDARSGQHPLLVPHGRAFFEQDIDRQAIGRLTAPTLLLYGTRSLAFEPALAAAFAELRPDLPLVHVDDAGHAVHADQPDAVADAIESWLAAAGDA